MKCVIKAIIINVVVVFLDKYLLKKQWYFYSMLRSPKRFFLKISKAGVYNNNLSEVLLLIKAQQQSDNLEWSDGLGNEESLPLVVIASFPVRLDSAIFSLFYPDVIYCWVHACLRKLEG